MALATRCPHCQTAFRVASDQLKLRAGLVRCGTCKEIFNGIENLLHPDEDINAAVTAPVNPAAGVASRWPAPTGPRQPHASTTASPSATAPVANSPATAVVAPPAAFAPAYGAARRDPRTRAEKSDNTLFQELINEVDHPPLSALPEPEPGPAAPPASTAPVTSGYAAAYAPVQLGPMLRTPSSVLRGLDAMRSDSASWQSQADSGPVEPAAGREAADSPDYEKPVTAHDDDPLVDGSTASPETESRNARASASLWQAATDDFDEDATYFPAGYRPSKNDVEDVSGSAVDRQAGAENDHETALVADKNDTAIAPAQASLSPLPGLLRPSRADAAHALQPDQAVEDSEDSRTELPGAAFVTAAATTGLRAKRSAPVASADDSLAEEMPDFVSQDLRRQGLQRTVRPLLITSAVLLALLLLAQLTYASRTSIAANFPQTRPLLDDSCRLMGCSVGLPMQIDSVSIESSDFQPLADKRDQFVLNVLLRNRGTTVQAWPSIELTLNDTTDKIVARRVIAPRDYLPANPLPAKGFATGSEQPIRLVFELVRLTASGYRVYLFYP